MRPPEDFEATIYIMQVGRLDRMRRCQTCTLQNDSIFPGENCTSFTKYCTFKKPTSRTSCTQPIKN